MQQSTESRQIPDQNSIPSVRQTMRGSTESADCTDTRHKPALTMPKVGGGRGAMKAMGNALDLRLVVRRFISGLFGPLFDAAAVE